ncbi:serine/threonine protein kinase SRPK1, partial [Trifolium medium]|nr:serine/threonine protein kinase SRPK1 [Trifolium medium]
LGHANWRLIFKLSKLDLVKGLPKLRPLELLHIDLFGPVSTASINGKKYGFVIVDDYSRWTWLKVTMVVSLRTNPLKVFVKNMEFSMNYLLLELHNKMEL